MKELRRDLNNSEDIILPKALMIKELMVARFIYKFVNTNHFHHNIVDKAKDIRLGHKAVKLAF